MVAEIIMIMIMPQPKQLNSKISIINQSLMAIATVTDTAMDTLMILRVIVMNMGMDILQLQRLTAIVTDTHMLQKPLVRSTETLMPQKPTTTSTDTNTLRMLIPILMPTSTVIMHQLTQMFILILIMLQKLIAIATVTHIPT